MTSNTFNDVKFAIISSALIFAFSLLFLPQHKNNVCVSFSDYYANRDNNNNCYYNPEYKLNVPEIIKRRGYVVEEYRLITKDNYILTLFRIPKKADSTNSSRPPVFLQHGAVVNCASFVNRGNKSLAFILADEGYDVWLGNFRGTLYSKGHKFLKHTKREYWHFDTYHHGVYDTSANIELIYKITGQRVIYVGHSFGTTAAYIYGVTFPYVAKERIQIIISLAPTLYVKHWKSITKYIIPFWEYMKPLIITLTNEELYFRGRPGGSLRKLLCTGYPFQMYLCQFFEMIVLGFDYEQNDPETLPITMIQNADAISYRTVTHCLQLIQKGRLDYYDHGVKLNQKIYGSPHPPSYNLSQLKVPTYFIRAENDLMITKEDVEFAHISLPTEANPYKIYKVNDSSFNHEDFITAKDVVPLLYSHLVDFINGL